MNAQLASSLPIPSYCTTPSQWNPDGCLFWSSDEIIFPYSGQPGDVFITTRVSISTSTLAPGCTDSLVPSTTDCRVPEIGSLPKKVYYIANVEDMTLQIDHTIRYSAVTTYGTPSLQQKTALDMKGEMTKKCSTSDLFYFDQNYREEAFKNFKTRLDLITVVDLLDAANCGDQPQFNSDPSKKYSILNSESFADGSKPGEPIRSAGLVISCNMV